MPRRALRLAALTTASVVATTTVCSGTPVAHADESPAPVTADDTATVAARGGEHDGVSFIDVLANDRAADGEELEICRVRAPERGLSVAEVGADGGFTIQSPSSGVSVSTDGAAEDGARESIAVLPWANRAGTYQFTYWACDSEHLSPATVTVTVRKTPEVTARTTERPGQVRFRNPLATRVVVIYGGPRQARPDGRFPLAARSGETRRVERRTIRWIAFSPRSGHPVGEGTVRGIEPLHSLSRSAAPVVGGPQVTARMLRAWRSA